MRDAYALSEQVGLLRAGLRSVVLPDLEAHGDSDQSLILPGRGESLGIQRRPKTEADYCSAVRHLVDEIHPAVRWRLPRLLEGLSYSERMLLRLRVGWGHTRPAVRRALGLSPRYAVDAEVLRLLQRLALELWDDDYQLRAFAQAQAAQR